MHKFGSGSDSLCVKKDVDRATTTFLRQFNSVCYRFNYVGLELLEFLFRTFTSSFYAIENWIFGVSFRSMLSIAVEWICVMNVCDSNHDVCKTADVSTFKHLYTRRQIKFLFSLANSQSLCLNPLRYYF